MLTLACIYTHTHTHTPTVHTYVHTQHHTHRDAGAVCIHSDTLTDALGTRRPLHM